LLVLLWSLFILNMSRQSYSEQSIQPLLHRLASEGALAKLVPDVTVRYHGAVIVAKKDPYRFMEFVFRKSAHLFVYAVLASFAFATASAARAFRGKRAIAALVALLFALLISLTDERLQAEAVQRTSAWEDVGVDSFGAAAGIAIVYFLTREKSRTSRP
jgi:VanZ family protein